MAAFVAFSFATVFRSPIEWFSYRAKTMGVQGRSSKALGDEKKKSLFILCKHVYSVRAFSSI